MKKKTLTVAIALVLVVALAVGATYAYLTAKTAEVKNTFVAGGAVNDGDLKLYEHAVTQNANGTYTLSDSKATADASGVYNAYTVMPGVNLPKDPTVTVSQASGAYYLFVEVTKGSGFSSVAVGEKTGTPLSYNVDTTKWEKLSLTGKDATREVYVYKVTTGTGSDVKTTYIQNGALTDVQVLSENTITVNADNDIVATLTSASASALTFNAYACQAAGFVDATAAFTACFGTK